MQSFDDFVASVRAVFGPGVVVDAAADTGPGGAGTAGLGAAGAPSLESSTLVPFVTGGAGLLAVGHLREPQVMNGTAVRYPDGWRVVVWQTGDGRRDPDRPRDPLRQKGESERWESARVRARARVRHLARCLGVDHLWTFTKRGKFESLDALWAAWKEFNRLMVKRHGSRWQYVAVPELHSDGVSWHLHVGVHGFWDVNQLRVYWHRALGARGLVRGQESPGNVDAKLFRGRSVRSISGYITKYIGKGFDAVVSGRRLFSSTVGIRPLERREFHFVRWAADFAEMHRAVGGALVAVTGDAGWECRVYGDGVRQIAVYESKG